MATLLAAFSERLLPCPLAPAASAVSPRRAGSDRHYTSSADTNASSAWAQITLRVGRWLDTKQTGLVQGIDRRRNVLREEMGVRPVEADAQRGHNGSRSRWAQLGAARRVAGVHQVIRVSVLSAKGQAAGRPRGRSGAFGLGATIVLRRGAARLARGAGA